jgi:hypothetical protein
MLGTIATSIITVTSITFSLLLLAVQQGATTLTAQVYDQFLRRRSNQAYFGFFIGLALYTLVVLGTTHPNYTPIYSAVLAFGLTVVALYLLILLIYATIDQMRPSTIVQNIREHTLRARERQLDLLCRTRQDPSPFDGSSARLTAKDSGYLALLSADALVDALQKCPGATDVVLLRSAGEYVSVGEDLAEVRFRPGALPSDVDAVRAAFVLNSRRDLDHDAAFGVEQLATIGWTSTSTSKSNPHPAMLVCRNLRDLIATWYPDGGEGGVRRAKASPIVYTDDVPQQVLLALESLGVVASESMQHQTLAEVYRALALAFRRMTKEFHDLIAQIVGRSTTALGDHVLTHDLDRAVEELITAMRSAGVDPQPLASARDKLARSIGKLAARSNRASPEAIARGSKYP